VAVAEPFLGSTRTPIPCLQEKYDFIRMWTRGKARKAPADWSHRASRLLRWLRGQPDVRESQRVFPRCLMACKSGDSLSLKLFKNVEEDKLELLLPEIRLGMSNFDRNILYGTLALTAIGYMVRMSAQVQTQLALGPVKGMMAAAAITAAFILYRLWDGIQNNKYRYLSRYHRTLYYQNLASNRSVLTLLVDRAAEEEYAETLLSYFVLATSPGPLTLQGLTIIVEDLLQKHFRLNVQFDTDDAIAKLQRLRLVESQRLHSHFSSTAVTVVPVAQALQRLQQITMQDMRP
jgi:hypothetical protein